MKGKQADMSIYSGVYKKKPKRSSSSSQPKSRTPTNPHPDDGLLGAGPSSALRSVPDIPNFVLSEDYFLGTISEREMLELVQKFGIDRSGVLSKDKNLLQRALQIFAGSLSQKVEEVLAENNRINGSSIQNVLTKDFEYSDDEEEKEKEPQPEKQKNLPHAQVLL